MTLQFEAGDIEVLMHNAESASALLRVIGCKWRLLIVCHLVTGEKNVTELQHYTGLRQSVLSQHLMVLRREELVSTRRVAQSIYYSLDSAVVIELIVTLHRHYCERIEAVESRLDQQSSSVAASKRKGPDGPRKVGRVHKAKVARAGKAKGLGHERASEKSQ